MNTTNPVFVILNLAVGGGIDALFRKPRHLDYGLEGAGVSARELFIVNANRIGADFTPATRDGRWAFSLSNQNNQEKFAQRVVDALFATITLVYRTDLSHAPPFHNGPFAYALSPKLVKHDSFVRRSDLLTHDPNLKYRLGYFTTIPEDTVDDAWKMLSATLRDPYFDAVHFFQESIRDFCFLGDAYSAVIYGEITQPVSRSEFVKAEDAVLNAFKAIEAIIGDPPKNQKKFRQRLVDAGLDPDEPIGFVDRDPDSGTDLRVPLWKKIRQMSYVRDKKAAMAEAVLIAASPTMKSWIFRSVQPR